MPLVYAVNNKHYEFVRVLISHEQFRLNGDVISRFIIYDTNMMTLFTQSPKISVSGFLTHCKTALMTGDNLVLLKVYELLFLERKMPDIRSWKTAWNHAHHCKDFKKLNNLTDVIEMYGGNYPDKVRDEVMCVIRKSLIYELKNNVTLKRFKKFWRENYSEQYFYLDPWQEQLDGQIISIFNLACKYGLSDIVLFIMNSEKNHLTNVEFRFECITKGLEYAVRDYRYKTVSTLLRRLFLDRTCNNVPPYGKPVLTSLITDALCFKSKGLATFMIRKITAVNSALVCSCIFERLIDRIVENRARCEDLDYLPVIFGMSSRTVLRLIRYASENAINVTQFHRDTMMIVIRHLSNFTINCQ